MSSENCENCGKKLTPISMEVQKITGGGKEPQLWCINCVRGELHKSGQQSSAGQPFALGERKPTPFFSFFISAIFSFKFYIYLEAFSVQPALLCVELYKIMLAKGKYPNYIIHTLGQGKEQRIKASSREEREGNIMLVEESSIIIKRRRKK